MDAQRKLYNLANRFLVGGVDSPVRSFAYVGGKPVFIKSGKGSRVYDYNNKEYLDYVLSWGSVVLGHNYADITRQLKQKIGLGLSFGTTNQSEVALARQIIQAVPFIEKIRFVNSGTEAVMGAVRLARGYTKKDKIIKFSHAYHGHADYLLAKAGSGLASLRISSSAGVPKDFVRQTLVLPFGDRQALAAAFKKNKNKIAGVLVEPVGGNYGVQPPDLEFLKYLRRITKENQTILIFDEVITGFRFHFGSAAELFKITPDLICLGKIIGGGLPIGAYGGKANIMNKLAPKGKVYQASTFSGNPIVMQAGLITLEVLKGQRNNYQRLKNLNVYLCGNLIKEALAQGIKLQLSYYGNMFSLRFRSKNKFGKFYRLMLKRGIFFAPSEFEANFLSFAHTQKDINRTLKAAKWAFAEIGERYAGRR